MLSFRPAVASHGLERSKAREKLLNLHTQVGVFERVIVPFHDKKDNGRIGPGLDSKGVKVTRIAILRSGSFHFARRKAVVPHKRIRSDLPIFKVRLANQAEVILVA
jgi:hypothetical protein